MTDLETRILKAEAQRDAAIARVERGGIQKFETFDELQPGLNHLLGALLIPMLPSRLAEEQKRIRAAILDRVSRLTAQRDAAIAERDRLQRLEKLHEVSDEPDREEAQSDRSALRASVSYWRRKAEKAEAERDQAIAERVQAVRDLDSWMADYDKQRVRADKAEAERDAAIADRTRKLAEAEQRLKNTVEHWLEKTGRLTAERDAAIAELDAARARAERAEAVVVRFPMPSGHMFTYAEQLKLMAEMNGWKARAEKVETERDAAIAERDEVRENIELVEAASRHVEAQRDAAIARAERAEALVESIKAQLATTADALVAESNRRENAKAGRAQAREHSRRWKARAEKVETERDAAIAERDALDILASSRFDEITDMISQRNDARAERDAAIMRAERAEALFTELPAGFAGTDDATVELAVECADLRIRLQKAESALAEARGVLQPILEASLDHTSFEFLNVRTVDLCRAARVLGMGGE